MKPVGRGAWKRFGARWLPFALVLPACEGFIGVDFDEVRNEGARDASPGGAAGSSAATGGHGGAAGTNGASGSADASTGGSAGTGGSGGTDGSAGTNGASGSGGSGGSAGAVGTAGTGAGTNGASGTAGSAGSDGGAPVTIGELRGLPNGPLNRTLQDVYVTYLRSARPTSNGFVVQAVPDGPAIFVFTGMKAATDVRVGNRITLAVHSLATFAADRQIDSYQLLSNDGQSFNVLETFAVDLAVYGGTVPGVDMECLLVKAQTVEVVGPDDQMVPAVFDVRYGDNRVRAEVRVTAPSVALCAGARFDIRSATVDRFLDDYRIGIHNDEDVQNLNKSGCSDAQ